MIESDLKDIKLSEQEKIPAAILMLLLETASVLSVGIALEINDPFLIYFAIFIATFGPIAYRLFTTYDLCEKRAVHSHEQFHRLLKSTSYGISKSEI